MSLQLTQLSHTYRSKGLEERTILQTIPQFTFPAGSQWLVRGVSGSGKTTLFNILAGLLRPTQGEVTLNQQPLYTLSEAQRDQFRTRHIGYIFQQHYLLPHLTAGENVMMPLAFAGVNGTERPERAQKLLAQVGLAEFAKHYPHQLSTGQRLRVAVVRALANNPVLVLADEPTAALDQPAGAQVLDLLQHSCQQNNAILLVASHDPAVSGRFAHQLELDRGVLSKKVLSAE
jgi:putative ABC transport system ATP-binding protein